jgi:hypothetical protein
MSILSVLCPLTACDVIGRCRSFGGTYCLCLQAWIWRQYVPPKRFDLRTSSHDVTITINYLFKVVPLFLSEPFPALLWVSCDFSPILCACAFLPVLILFWAFYHSIYFVSVTQQWTRRPELMKSNRKVISVPPKTTQCLLYGCHSRRPDHLPLRRLPV